MDSESEEADGKGAMKEELPTADDTESEEEQEQVLEEVESAGAVSEAKVSEGSDLEDAAEEAEKPMGRGLGPLMDLQAGPLNQVSQ